MIILGLTGFAASGKNTFGKILEKYGFKRYVFSDVIRLEAKKRGLLEGKNYEEQKDVLSVLGDTLREETGRKGIVAEMLIDLINTSGYPRVVVDGFRSVEEVKLFKKSFRGFRLIYVKRSAKKRFDLRKHEDPMIDEKSFHFRDARDKKNKGLGEVVKMADIIFSNNGAISEIYNKTEAFTKKLLKEKYRFKLKNLGEFGNGST